MRIFRNSLLAASLAATALLGGPYAYGLWLIIEFDEPVYRVVAPLHQVNRAAKGDRLVIQAVDEDEDYCDCHYDLPRVQVTQTR